MSLSEQSLLDAELMAVHEINERGGVLGCRIEPVVADGASTPEEFARQADRLISSGVRTLFGCWTSASRKSVRSVVEAVDGLLWYPVQYEGLEESPHIVYTGSCLNQQITPATEWALANIGRRVLLVGSDYVFPRTANKLIRSLVESDAAGGTIVAERYLPLGDQEVTELIGEIRDRHPQVVLNTLNGDSNLAFFRELRAAGLSADRMPVLSVSVAETELQTIADMAQGHFACWNYFQTLDRPENRQFVARFRKRCGPQRVCTASMVQAYSQIYLWTRAVETASTFDTETITQHLTGQAFTGPGGPITIESNHHVAMNAYVGGPIPRGSSTSFGAAPDRSPPCHGWGSRPTSCRTNRWSRTRWLPFPTFCTTARCSRTRSSGENGSSGNWIRPDRWLSRPTRRRASFWPT